ncbi:MAG: molybdopterin-dependent oxidoreductase [Hahellaceae bacterium]|nr:molybdopterin-dependent oxidoreductase [Hahellaceae bacterium]MCP5168864.1 molybdopterin-dependent oxidoreductase [Hahellaceae bacterium]
MSSKTLKTPPQSESSPLKHRTLQGHFEGKTLFTDDLPVPESCLYAAVVTSPVAHAELTAIVTSEAEKYPGVVAILTARDIPGSNQIGDIVQDERLLAEHHLNFIGKPVALVLANTAEQAHQAADAVQLQYHEKPSTLDVKTAYRENSTFGDERHFQKGDIAHGFEDAQWVVEGDVDTQAQEHLYFETQVSLAIPMDGQHLKIFSATQSPSAVQKFAASVLGLPMNAVEVEVLRLGGAFGGKEEQAKPWALLAALGAFVTQKPVKLVLSRHEDMHWTGKRHPYHSHYRLGLDSTGKILAYDVQFLQDGGAVADLSTAVLERTLFHATNAYAIENVNVKAVSCRTHHPSNTAFRGFGAPQAIFTLESAIDHAARVMGCPRWHIQQANLLQPGYKFAYGMTYETNALQQCWSRLWSEKSIARRMRDLEQTNRSAPRYRKSIALTPLCFGIAFTATHLNQASVQVNIYTDGSVGIATSSVEMGQGVNEKIREVVARCFGISFDMIHIDYTHSARTANMSPTAASVGADLNGMATLQACSKLKSRLLKFCSQRLKHPVEHLTLRAGNVMTDQGEVLLEWRKLVTEAYLSREHLCELAHYATPDLYFDRTREQGHPFAYHACGVSAIEITLDTLLGTYQVEHIDVVYDLGESLDPLVDLGQMEGGLVQGVGYATLEEILWDSNGRLITDSFATYKIPDLMYSPRISVDFIQSGRNPYGPFSSKAIGEPPLLLGLGAYFAITDAIRSHTQTTEIPYQLPMTPEKALSALYPSFTATS